MFTRTLLAPFTIWVYFRVYRGIRERLGLQGLGLWGVVGFVGFRGV